MMSFGLDLAKSPAQALSDGLAGGLVYALLVVFLAGLYFLQQRMVAARAAVSPTMSPSQQKLMQYLPVAFAMFQVFFLTGLIIYYMAQALLRIAQQAYITRRFYGHDESLGARRSGPSDRRASWPRQDAGGRRRRKKASSPRPATRRHEATRKPRRPRRRASSRSGGTRRRRTATTKRTTAPKGRPTPTGKSGSRPPSNGRWCPDQEQPSKSGDKNQS